jgi:N-alpha-acetyltransferase 40
VDSQFSCVPNVHNTDAGRTGLAGTLMELLEGIGRQIPETAKMMLTCFTSNKHAAQFYARLGYSVDEYSPPPRILRNGTRVDSEYLILSKALS